MSLLSKIDQCKRKRLDDKARCCREYEDSIYKLFKKSQDGCLFSLTQTKVELETRKLWINLVGNGIILFLIQVILSGCVLLFLNYFDNVVLFKPLLFLGVFAIVVLFIIYVLMLHYYRQDRIKFEIQNRRFQELVVETK